MAAILGIADDLTGAAETCAALVSGIAHSAQPAMVDARVALMRETGSVDVSATITVIDTDARAAAPQVVAQRVEAALTAGGEPSPLVFGKIDSALRGNVVALLEALVVRGRVVVAPANPSIGRITRQGIVHHRGTPLHATDLWRAEDRSAPPSIEALLRPRFAPVLIDSDVVAAGAPAVAEAIRAAPVDAVIVCDALTDAHLDIIATSAMLTGARLVGSAGIAQAIARSGAVPPSIRALQGPAAHHGSHPLLVVGTASAAGHRQVDQLRAAGTPVVDARPADLLDGAFDVSALTAALRSGPAVVRIAADRDRIGPESPALARSLAHATSRVARDRPLVLIGGTTARAVLDVAAVQWLQPIAELEVGAVLSLTDSGAGVVTRPGSFGDDASLVRILAELERARVRDELASTPERYQQGGNHGDALRRG